MQDIKLKDQITYRSEPAPSDCRDVREIASSSGFFYPEEIEIAVELVEERLAKGEKSGYFFLFAEAGGRVAAYSCFGPIACTRSSFDLYWIAVRDELRGSGIGRELLDRSERAVVEQGGSRIYVETSSRAQYEPTRAFYRRCGYREEARLKDFYAPGDDKIVYVKVF